MYSVRWMIDHADWLYPLGLKKFPRQSMNGHCNTSAWIAGIQRKRELWFRWLPHAKLKSLGLQVLIRPNSTELWRNYNTA